MIKINLLKNVGTANSAGGADKPRAAELSPTSAAMNQQAILKLIVLLLPCLALFLIEKYNISILTAKLAAIATQVAKVEADIRSYGNTGADIEKYGAIKAKLEKQFDALQAIGLNRLREVKTLDSLQTIIPGRNWISELNIDEGGRVQLQGFSETPDEAFKFVRSIEESPNFSDVTKVKVASEENQTPGAKQAETFKKYSFEFRIGKAK